jgi:hypothetical protein
MGCGYFSRGHTVTVDRHSVQRRTHCETRFCVVFPSAQRFHEEDRSHYYAHFDECATDYEPLSVVVPVPGSKVIGVWKVVNLWYLHSSRSF